MYRKPVRCPSVRGLAPGTGRRLGLFHRRGPAPAGPFPVILLEQQRCEPPTHVPLQVIGQHAQEHVAAHMILGVDIDGPHPQVGLGDPERPLHAGQALVGLDRGLGADGFRRKAGADDIDPVEAGLVRDLLLTPLPGDAILPDGDLEVFLDLLAIGLTPDASPDLRLAGQGPGPDPGHDALQRMLRGLQQFLPLPAALLPQARVEANHEPFAGKVRAGDLGHRVGHQRIRRQRRGGAGGGPGKLAQVRRLQRRDPGQAGRLQIRPDPGRGDHPAVPHQGDAGNAEPGADLLHLGRHRGRIGGIAGKQFHRNRTPLGTAQQAEDDLPLALLPVPVVAEGGQRTALPLQVGARYVVENQGPVPQVTPGQGPLDPWLALEQPVQHVEQFIAADRAEPEQGAETAGGGLRRQAPRSGQPGVRRQDPGDDRTKRQLPLAAAGAVQQAFEPEPAGGPEHRNDIAVVEGALDVQEVGQVADGHTALEDGAEPLDDLGGHLREVGNGLLADSGSFAPCLAQEHGGLAGLVGDDFDVEGHWGMCYGNI